MSKNDTYFYEDSSTSLLVMGNVFPREKSTWLMRVSQFVFMFCDNELIQETWCICSHYESLSKINSFTIHYTFVSSFYEYICRIQEQNTLFLQQQVVKWYIVLYNCDGHRRSRLKFLFCKAALGL